MVRRLPARIVLSVIHFLFLAFTYVKFFLQQIYFGLRGRRRIAGEALRKIQRIPNHISLVISEDACKFSAQIAEVVDFLIEVPQISLISLFFRREIPKLLIDSKKVRVFHNEDVSPAFRKVMEARTPLTATSYPLDERVDLAVIYSRSSSMSNFFPWVMDLATFIIAGPVVNLSPPSVVRAMEQFEKTEQRFGK
jgi:hypothetical protein